MHEEHSSSERSSLRILCTTHFKGAQLRLRRGVPPHQSGEAKLRSEEELRSTSKWSARSARNVVLYTLRSSVYYVPQYTTQQRSCVVVYVQRTYVEYVLRSSTTRSTYYKTYGVRRSRTQYGVLRTCVACTLHVRSLRSKRSTLLAQRSMRSIRSVAPMLLAQLVATSSMYVATQQRSYVVAVTTLRSSISYAIDARAAQA